MIELFGQASVVASVISAFMSIAAAVVSFYIGRSQVKSANRDTVMSATVDCNNRYDNLFKARDEIERDMILLKSTDVDSKIAQFDVDRKVENYFRRYWSLKSDQIDYWILGYIESDSLATWLYSMFDAFARDKRVGNVSYRDSWMAVRKEQATLNPTMTDVVEKMISDIEKLKYNSQESYFIRMFAIMLEIEGRKSKLLKTMRHDDLSFAKLKGAYSRSIQSKIDDEVSQIRQGDRP